MRIFKILAIWCFILGSTLAYKPVLAQSESSSVTIATEPEVEMADTLRQDGKIYVVVVVLLTVLAGMIIYLVTLDRKVSKLEKQLKD
jgi:hypothetical protein